MTAANPQAIALAESDLPEGWVLSRLSEVCQINPPKAPPYSLEPNQPVTFVPMPGVDADRGAITTPQERPFSEVRRGYTCFQDDDVIMAKITPCMENGKAAIAHGLTNGLGFGSTEFHVLRSNGAVLPEYVYSFIRQKSFRRAAEAEMTGSVGQKRVPQSFLEDTELPLPPKDEQKRIVEKVEQLLTRVNAARQRLARVPIILKLFRQAVLAAACSGRLTADWREQHPEVEPSQTLVERITERRGQDTSRRPRAVPQLDSDGNLPDLPESWAWVPAGLAYVDARYGTSVKCHKDMTHGVPVLRVPNIARGLLDLSDLKFTRLSKSDLSKLMLHEGDVLVCRTNGSLDLVGKAAVTQNLSRPHAFASYLIRLRLDESTALPHYFHCFLSSQFGRQQIEEKARTTAGQFNLNLEILGGLAVPLPPLDEQREIVRRVAALFKLADAIERRVAAGTKRADKLTQAILARAFRGELVPTEAELARREGRSYESASALLSRIRAERGDSHTARAAQVRNVREPPEKPK